MAEPIKSLTQRLIYSATDPFSLALLTGVTSSSFWFFGNLGLALDGTLPATITESERSRKGISNISALKMWEWMYNRAKKHFASAGLLGGISYLVASTFRPDLRYILYGASFFAFSPIPYTLAILMPTNKNIFKISGDSSKPNGKAPDPGRVDELFSEWRTYHSIRMSFGAIGWALGMAVILLA